MSAPSLGRRPAVVVCPALAPDLSVPSWHAPLQAALRIAGIPFVAPEPGRPAGDMQVAEADDRLALAGWVADLAVAITGAGLDRDLVLMASGAGIRGLPALGLAQRAARRAVVGYVLVDGHPPAPSTQAAADWPEAPVLYVRSPGADPLGSRAASLRGWRCVHADPVRAIPAHVDVWPERPVLPSGTLGP